AGDLDSTTSFTPSSSGFPSLPSGVYSLEPSNGQFLAGQVTLPLTVLSDTISEPQRDDSIRVEYFHSSRCIYSLRTSKLSTISTDSCLELVTYSHHSAR